MWKVRREKVGGWKEKDENVKGKKDRSLAEEKWGKKEKIK